MHSSTQSAGLNVRRSSWSLPASSFSRSSTPFTISTRARADRPMTSSMSRWSSESGESLKRSAIPMIALSGVRSSCAMNASALSFPCSVTGTSGRSRNLTAVGLPPRS